MESSKLKKVIKEEIIKILAEEYIDKYKVKGILVTNTALRPQQEILSDIRALTGVTIVSTVDLDGEYSQDNDNLRVILNLKIDGYPFIKQGGFSREKIQSIIIDVKKIEGVKSYIVNPQNITPL